MSESDILHALEDTQFPQKLRGYDPAEVDDLIDRASREIADLRAEHKAALDRAELAERRLDQELDATEKARATAEAEIATAEAEGYLTLRSLDLTTVLERGQELLASTGIEFELAVDTSKPKDARLREARERPPTRASARLRGARRTAYARQRACAAR